MPAFLSTKIQKIPEHEKNLLGQGLQHKHHKWITHNDLHHSLTAVYRTDTPQKLVALCLILIVITGLIINWHLTLVLITSALTSFLFLDLLLSLYLIFKSFMGEIEIEISDEELNKHKLRNWPTYTIFCPLYKEARVLEQFISAMCRLDYPKDKLQVLLLLEDDDKVTINKAHSLKLPTFFEIVIVPHSYPKTKPKACNFGLKKAMGEYSVIYDAEDIPDEKQLKKTILAFEQSSKDVVCIQAKLNFYNPKQNLLTKLFTAEYSLWFDLVLTGLQSINSLIPLGGTSNHFITQKLKALGGWDAFNVTEDADLGVRLFKSGYKTAIVNSTTLEEANGDILSWIRQRSRWIKGYMQTYLVHMRKPLSGLSFKNLLIFQLIIGGRTASTFINPLLWALTAIYFLYRPVVGDFIDSLYLAPIFYMGFFTLIIGNFLYVYYYMLGCLKKGHYDLVKYAFFVPLYWLSMSIAAYLALFKLIVDPHHWSKTSHGEYLFAQVAETLTEL